MKSNYDVLGKYIVPCDELNSEGELTLLQGISNEKYFQGCKSNTNDIDLTRYRICRKGWFCYNRATTRNGEKISIAYREEEDCLVSPSYKCFKIVDENKLDPIYLLLWFKRPEFDRYARFMSHGSAHEYFEYEQMCDVMLPVPSIEEQRKIVANYLSLEHRISLLKQINDNLLAQAQTYFSSVFAGKDTEETLPEGWKFAKVGDYCIDNVGNLSKNDTFDTIFYLDTGSITDNYIVELQELNLTTDEIPSRAKRKVTHGDIIYSTVRPNLRHYGLLQNPPNNLIVSTGFAVLHNKGLAVSNDFLFMWLTTESVLEYLQAIAENSVSTYPSLNVSDLLNVKIVVPDDITLANINNFLITIFSSISENNRQIKILTSSMSILLPKLLSSR